MFSIVWVHSSFSSRLFADTLLQTSVSILFVGYILMQVPSNIFLNKIGKPALYLPACMAMWGAISACSGATQSYGGLIAVRFMLGFVEAVYFVRYKHMYKSTCNSFANNLIAWVPLLPFVLVHKEGVGTSICITLFWIAH